MKNSIQDKTVKNVIEDIRNILNLPTEVMDDGECLDLIDKYIASLEQKGE